MSESGELTHPLVPALLFHRDSFLHYFSKVQFHLGEDPSFVPRIMRWLNLCDGDAQECKRLGHQILLGGSTFLIGESPATLDLIEFLYQQRRHQINDAESLARGTQWRACRIVPGRTLERHEIPLKRHTLAKHVGLSVDQLKSDLARNSNRHHASAFFDRSTAESAIARVIGLYSAYISARFRAGAKQIDLPKQGGIDTGLKLGHVVARDGTVTISTHVRVILIRDNSDPSSFYIRTAYPTL